MMGQQINIKIPPNVISQQMVIESINHYQPLLILLLILLLIPLLTGWWFQPTQQISISSIGMMVHTDSMMVDS